jgi:tRNA pseudouridine55 synthase
VVDRVRRALGLRAVGHAGTLDPFATGLLIVLVGRATRLARFVERRPKGYLAEAVLGIATDTDDGTGAVIESRAARSWPDEPTVRGALESFRGIRPQRPPAYSARRVEGQRGYRLARAGQAVDLPPRDVTVHRIELLAWEPPVVRFRAEVSAGTYVRALARDLGAALGTVAHCRALRREWIGPFRVEDAIPPDALTALTPLLPPLRLVPDLPRVELDAAGARAAGQGRLIPAEGPAGPEAALVHDGRLIAVAEPVSAGWQPRVVLEPA